MADGASGAAPAGTTVNSPAAQALLDELLPVADRARRETGTPGVVLGVLAAGERATAGLGVAGLSRPRPVDETTLFRLCSITKPFMGTLAFALAERGRLDLDRLVRDYLPDLRVDDPALLDVITPRHLLQHTSGLECEIRADLGGFGTNDDALAKLLAEFPRVRQFAPPGSAWGYCNTGYWLLGALLATVAEQPYEAAMHDHVLAPLGLTDTVFRAEDAIMRDVALPHRPVAAGATEHEQLPTFDFPRARRPSGGLVASLRDVLTFAESQLPEANGPRGLSPESLRELHEPTVTAYHPDVRWTPGWAVKTVGDAHSISHGGRNEGYRTFLVLLPERSVAVAVLTNSGAGLPVLRAVETAVYRQVYSVEPTPPTFVDLPPERLAAFEGDYWFPNVDQVTIRADAGQLVVTAEGAPPRADEWQRERVYRPVSDTQFVELADPDEGIGLTFLPGLSDSDSMDHMRLGHRLGRRVPQAG